MEIELGRELRVIILLKLKCVSQWSNGPMSAVSSSSQQVTEVHDIAHLHITITIRLPRLEIELDRKLCVVIDI